MKNVLILLLSIITLQVQGQNLHYYPSYTDSYAKVVGQDVSILVVLPNEYRSDQTYPYMIFVHGMGQRGPGTKSALNTVYTGANQAIPDDWKAAVNKYGIIGVLVNYNDFFQPDKWLWSINFIKSKYKVVDKPMAQGFSWGAGSLQKLYCTSTVYAGLPSVAIPIAPTIELNAGWENVSKANLPVWIHVNKGDNVTGAATAKRSADYINSFSPSISATYTEYNQQGHGGTNEALSLAPPTGYAENVYEWYLDVLLNGPRVPRKGTVTQPTDPVPIPTTGPVINIDPVPNITTTGTVSLNACKSTGYEYITWTVFSVPKGVNLYTNFFPKGAGNCSVSWATSIEGTYGVKAVACKGGICVSDTLYLTYQKTTVPVPVIPKSYDSKTGYLVFSDGTRIAAVATVDFATKKVTIKDQAGITYTW